MMNVPKPNVYRWLKVTERGREIAIQLCLETLARSSVGREVARHVDLREGSLFVSLPLSYDESAFIQRPIHASILDGDLDHQAIDELVALIVSWRSRENRDILMHTCFLLEYISSVLDYSPYLLVHKGDVFARATTHEADARNAMEFIWRFERLTPYNLFFFETPLAYSDPSPEFGVPIIAAEQVLDLAKNTQMISTMAFDGAGYILWAKQPVDSPKELAEA